jgi:hypothetical protein
MFMHLESPEICFESVPAMIDSNRPFILKLGTLFVHFTAKEAEQLEYLVTSGVYNYKIQEEEFSSALDHRALEAESVPATPFYKDVKAKVFPS